MNRINTMLLVASAVLVGGTLARPLFAPSPVQAHPAPGPEAGRYQLEISNNGSFFFMDTRTGRLWIRTYPVEEGKQVVKWVEMDSPVSKAK